MMDDVWQWCSETGNFGRTVTVKIKFADFQQITCSRSVIHLITTESAMQEHCLALTRSVFPLRARVRLVGVTLSNFDMQAGDEEAQPGFL